jgi:hypothetical protein
MNDFALAVRVMREMNDRGVVITMRKEDGDASAFNNVVLIPVDIRIGERTFIASLQCSDNKAEISTCCDLEGHCVDVVILNALLETL